MIESGQRRNGMQIITLYEREEPKEQFLTPELQRARRLELGTVSAEPLSRAYWSQKLRPLGETVGLSRARTSGESPDSTQAGRGPQWPIQLAAISAHPAAMVGTGMPKLRGRTGNEP